MKDHLRLIRVLIKERKFTEARHALEDYLALNENDAEAWYLRSFVEPEPERKVSALKQARKLDPYNGRANDRLASLTASIQRHRGRSAVWRSLLLALWVLIAVMLTLFALLNSPPRRALPTPPVPMIVANTTATTLPATDLPTMTPDRDSTDEAASTDNAPAVTPLRLPRDVGIGSMLVYAATYDAARAIDALGGSAPEPSTDQEWVLVEAVLACDDAQQCALSPDALALVDGEGRLYPASPDLDLTPAFGAQVTAGQLVGYLGFVAPADATDLRLRVTQSGDIYEFALE